MEEKNTNHPEESEETVYPEIEGGNWLYFYVCSECHTLIDWHMERCPECKRRINCNV